MINKLTGLQVYRFTCTVLILAIQHVTNLVEIYPDQKVYWFTGLHIEYKDTLEYFSALVCMVYRFTGLQCYEHFDMYLS